MMVAVDAASALLATYYLRPNPLTDGAHVANSGYLAAEHCCRQKILSPLYEEM